uniref:ASCH domain-containing protein n=1 Tax=Rhodopseudomonas palustris (strain DX-1) TaxID=652103 RepID=E6VFK8_RHOPX
MADYPIIFSAPMVCALLDGRKTMTRRIAWRESKRQAGVFSDPKDREARPSPWQKVRPGDRLWVRENFARVGTTDPGFFVRQADYPDCASQYGFDGVPPPKEVGYKWTPSIHMPRRLSRLTLIVTAAKIERLQAINKEDVISEGVTERDGFPIKDVFAGWHEPFAALWCSLHGSDAWDANPEVVALSFRVVRGNIDSTEALAA